MKLGSNNNIESLVFSLDVDNSKSFPGQPTTNLLVGGSNVANAISAPWLLGTHAGCLYTDVQNYYYSKDRPHVSRYYSTNNTGYSMVNQQCSIVNQSGTTYTYSYEYKILRGTVASVFGGGSVTIYPNGYKTPAGVNGGNIISNVDVPLSDGWYRKEIVYISDYTGNNTIRFNFFTGGYALANGFAGVTADNGNFDVLIDNYMFTEGTNVPLFTDSSRSATQSLVDLKREVEFDVSSISFTSDGYPSFDGSNDQIIMDSYASLFNPDENFSVEAHMKLNDIVANSVFLAYGGNGSNGGFLFQIEFSGGLELNIFSPSGGQRASIGTGATYKYENEVIHMIGTYDGATVKLYINGVLAQQQSGTYRPNTQTTLRMGNEYNRSYYGNFDLYSMKLYNVALTQEQVVQHYNNAKGKRPTGFDLGKLRSNPATTATDILNNNPDAADGVYWLKPSGVSEPFQVPIKFYLGKAMVCVMKGGQREGFVPDSAYWENDTLLNEDDFSLYNGSASKYRSYTTIPFTEFYFNMGALDYQTTFALPSQVSSMLVAQQRGWNDVNNRDVARFGKSVDYRTLTGADASITSNLGTEIYPMGMDLKHQGHYSSSGNSGGRIRVGAITDESTGNTNNQAYGNAGSAYGIGVNGGNPLKTGVCGYAGWAQSDIYGKDYNWSVWIIN